MDSGLQKVEPKSYLGTPDMTTFRLNYRWRYAGRAYGGRKEIMDFCNHQLGQYIRDVTLSWNPIAMAAD